MKNRSELAEPDIREYRMDEAEILLKWEGRILKRKEICYLGYTNSSITMRVKGKELWMRLITGENEVVNCPGLRIYVDGIAVSEVILDRRKAWYHICGLNGLQIQEVKVVKITEAAMSYAGLSGIRIKGGSLIPFGEIEDNRIKVEFIGDSITCGYGVHGAAESEYTIREEDGECSYAAFMVQKMNWNARWISASGYGAFVEYTGNPERNVPKLYPYVNWFLDKEKKIKKGEFEPEYIFVNLGTNDSRHLYRNEIQEGFLTAYEDFLKLLKEYHPEAVILCLLGTVCKNTFPYVKKVVEKVKEKGLERIYSFELPYHNVAVDGMASCHPSVATHKKDAERILEFMKQEGLLSGRVRMEECNEGCI